MKAQKDRTWIIYFAVAVVVITAAIGIPRWIARAHTNRAAARIREEYAAAQNRPASLLFPLQPFLFTVKEGGTTYRVNIDVSLGYDPTVAGLSNEILQRRADLWFEISDLLDKMKKSEMDEESEKTALKELVKQTANSILTNGAIHEVYFRKFLVAPY